MAISKTKSQILWGGSSTIAVAAAGNSTSDAQAISDNAVSAGLVIKADNAGTPASGDELSVKILYTHGDPDADPDVADEYDTAANAGIVAVLDTNAEDPVVVSIPIAVAATGFKVYVSNGAASNSLTVSAQYVEQTAT